MIISQGNFDKIQQKNSAQNQKRNKLFRKQFVFSGSVHYFSTELCQNFFGLRSEAPSRDLNSDRGNRLQ